MRRVRVDLAETDAPVRVLERTTEDVADLTRAEVLVVGGAGTRGDFALLEELAGLLDGEFGVTRVAVDAGWAGTDCQIGQTGFVTRPKLAIVCGASGALQFTVGIEEADTVVAVNVDDEAPIFEAADYGIVGNLFEFLPALISELKLASNGIGSASN